MSITHHKKSIEASFRFRKEVRDRSAWDGLPAESDSVYPIVHFGGILADIHSSSHSAGYLFGSRINKGLHRTYIG